MTERPNFLFIINDQHRADHLGCYGNPIVRTPHIDSIAANGARFENFYVATPICGPNRSTLMTGRMPSLHGARMNGIPLPLGATTFVDLLRAAGYATGLIGKCHLQGMAGTAPVAGIPTPEEGKIPPPADLSEAVKPTEAASLYEQEFRSNWVANPDFEMALPYYGFDHMELTVGHGDRVVGHYTNWLAARHGDPDSLRGPENQLPGNDRIAPQAWPTAIPEELYPTRYIEERTIAYLEDRAKDDTKPFYLQCSFPDPHHPFTPPGKYWDMYDPATIPVPDAFDHGNHKPPDHLAWFHAEREAGTANREVQQTFAVTEREVREAIALNYGMITMIDDAVGRILATLEATGLAENTVVIFNTDHGDFMGDHQLLLKGALHYRGLIRVPFIWADPAAPETAGHVSGEMCGTLDIGATVLDRAGLAPHNGNQGKSLIAAAHGGATGWDSVVIEEHQRKSYMGLDYNFRARSLLTERWRLTIYDGFKGGELYDLIDDPNEFDNRWDDPVCSSIRSGLMEALVRHMMSLTDTSPLATQHGP
jgi:arylsulfatase A-like enzyme